MRKKVPQIGIIMSSEKDLPGIIPAAEILKELGIPFEMTALSPYRLPDGVREYGLTAEEKGFEVILAASGGTNELAGAIAPLTCIPIIGIPLRPISDSTLSSEIAAIFSSLETPPGVPIATVGYDDAVNAAFLAAQILGVKDRRVRRLLESYRKEQQQRARERALNVEERGRQIQGNNA